LTIHQAAYGAGVSIPFIPLLAEEGVKLKVGGVGKREGLVVANPWSDPNGLQSLACYGSSETEDSISLGALKRLRKSNLLKKYIREFDLLIWSWHPTSQKRFDYLFIRW